MLDQVHTTAPVAPHSGGGEGGSAASSDAACGSSGGCGEAPDACPPQCAVLPRDRIRRRVLLRNERGDRYAFAVSWWGREAYAAFMRDTTAPIGATMATARLAVFREIFAVSRGTAPALHGLLGITDAGGVAPELWCRHYMMWASGQPLCLICEVFSPALQRWMGPIAPAAALPPVAVAAVGAEAGGCSAADGKRDCCAVDKAAGEDATNGAGAPAVCRCR